MTLLCVNSTPAERARGLAFSENFANAGAVVRNNGTIVGAPSIHFGAVLDGTNDYITYHLTGHEFNSAELSVVIEATPDFDYDEDAVRYFFDSTAGGTRHFLYKDNNAGNNVLSLFLGGILIAAIPSAAYAAAWAVNERNTIVVSSTTGATDVWLNETQILTADVTAWTPDAPATLWMGSDNAGANKFDGILSQFKVFRSLLTSDEALHYYDHGAL